MVALRGRSVRLFMSITNELPSHLTDVYFEYVLSWSGEKSSSAEDFLTDVELVLEDFVVTGTSPPGEKSP